MPGFSPFNKGKAYTSPAYKRKYGPPKVASSFPIAPEDEIMADMDPINLKVKDTRKKDTKIKTKSEHKKSKIDVKTAKKLYGKDSPEYAAAVGASEATKEAKKKSQTGREKIRAKIKEKKDERTRKKNINKTRREQKRKIDEQAKWLKDNPNIPMP